jgi:hypothetical protein
MFVDYRMACEVTGIEPLATRRQARCLAFAKGCLKNNQTEAMFPVNPDAQHNLREAEKYMVNFAHTENYRNSAVPYIYVGFRFTTPRIHSVLKSFLY